jgi:RNA polymerase sigma-70 factor (ECF subfamily)
LTILYSIFVNRYRRDRRLPSHVSLEELEGRDLSALAAPAAGPSGPVGGWSEREVEAALEELPEPFRAAVLLVDVEELTYEEAAAALGCAVGTVCSRLFRARRLLAAALGEFARDRGFVSRKAGSE